MSLKKSKANNPVSFIKNIKFDSQGLVPAVAQDYRTKDILMVAYMNRQSLSLTLETGIVHYFSRSRNKLWKKGEESGNIQKVKAVFMDCDGDCILVQIDQIGGAACHTGFRSCFYRKHKAGSAVAFGKKVFDPKKVYSK